MKRLILILVVLSGLIITAEASRRRLLTTTSGGGGGGGGYTAHSIDWSGTNQNVTFTGSMTLMGAGKEFTMAGWVDPDTDGTGGFLAQGRNGSSGPSWRASITAAGAIRVIATDTNGTPALDVYTADGVAEAADGWVHFAVAVDNSSTANRQFYVAGTNCNVTWNIFTTNVLYALNRTDSYFGTDDSSGNDYNGKAAEFYMKSNRIDLASNITKFINAGNPVSLGTDGSAVDGVAPTIYLRFRSGALGVNSGAGGGTGTLNGPPTSGPTFP